jgi:hypothetical protein
VLFRSLLVACLAIAGTLEAQPSRRVGREEVFTGGEMEDYLRTLEALGLTRAYPWSLRGFGPREVAGMMPADSAKHPWRDRYDFHRPTSEPSFEWIRPRAGAKFNSAFPWGINDGAVWAGRGATGWVSGGFRANWHAVSLRVYPGAFLAQNADFDFVSTGRPGSLQFGDARYSQAVDLPQRFGDRPYGRVDPGESELRVDVPWLSAGISSSHEWWGPSQRYPYLLGTNAAGFPHLFVSTPGPINIGVGRIHARVLWGRLWQSGYFKTEALDSSFVRSTRFATGLAGVFQPLGSRYFEIGAARFVHVPWPDQGLQTHYFTKVINDFFKKSIPHTPDGIVTDKRSRDGDNQLGAVFGRWVFPKLALEAYAEFGREDYPWDSRLLILTPDEQSSRMFGLARYWAHADGQRISRLRLESITFQPTPVDRSRGGRPTYTHGSGSNQGHTQMGQLLGAGVGVSSAAGAFISFDRLSPSGRWSGEWSRVVRQDAEVDGPATADFFRHEQDVVHTLSVERLLFRRGSDVTVGAAYSRDFNRDFRRDRSNVSVQFSVVGLP